PGKPPFPAVVVLHGGMSRRNINRLVSQSKRGPLCTRLLAAGYVVVVATYRSYEDKSRDPGPIHDCVAIVDHLRRMTDVDNESIVVFGHSGGGRLALELSGLGERTGLAAIACGEPATTLYAEMYPEGMRGPNMEVSKDLDRYFRNENREILERKVQELSTPVLIVYSDRHHINILNNRRLVPAIRAAGKDLRTALYPGYGHGFVWGRSGVTKEVFAKLVNDLDGFYREHVRSRPQPMSLPRRE
ncbi:MAG: alpha/beta hydrolase, partial [bacterium]|nr:alpha/beta hydrolase [bacterium]